MVVIGYKSICIQSWSIRHSSSSVGILVFIKLQYSQLFFYESNTKNTFVLYIDIKH